MILKLPFKQAWYYIYKDVEVLFRIGVLEDVCEHLGIKFYQIDDFIKNNHFDYNVLILYYAYRCACEKSGKKIKYTLLHAGIWYEHASTTEREKIRQGFEELSGKISEHRGKKKVK